MSDLLYFSEHTLQEVALVIMAVVYSLRIRWLLKFKSGGDRQAPTGSSDTNQRKGILYSWGIIAMPWAMESTRTKIFFYIQFIIFHLGVIASIGLSFIIPYAPSFLTSSPIVIPALQIIIGGAFLVGVMRIIRRFTDKYIRAISTPDDYFSLVMLTVWFRLGACTQAYLMGIWGMTSETLLVVYLYLTSFFLLYVPFSKISHYLYYPFTRTYIGRALGQRGSYPVSRG